MANLNDERRLSGFYWVKKKPKSEWEIAEWDYSTQRWIFFGSQWDIGSAQIFEIDEEQVIKG